MLDNFQYTGWLLCAALYIVIGFIIIDGLQKTKVEDDFSDNFILFFGATWPLMMLIYVLLKKYLKWRGKL